ncbi:MAG: tRNA (adenosine(37)-N6)-dimethylallyltransferase MiaA [Rectinemataceae bacterium]
MSTVSSRIKVLVLAGPTASGKTELLDRIFGLGASAFSGRFAGRFAGRAEIISADSMQAYRGMDIGTAKPGALLLEGLPHHLIDIRDPDEQYTVGDFVTLADGLCANLAADGILPVVAGGTGFYLRNFICGLPSGPPADPLLRAEVAHDLVERGGDSLRAELAAADPLAASRIALRDEYRLTRAVEILRATGRKPSDFAPSGDPRQGFDFLVLGLERPRDELASRIDKRVDAMFASGLAREVAGLVEAGYGPSSPGMAAIGYREFFASPAVSPELLAEAIKLDTRRYAKRQMTFFRKLPGIRWIPPDPEALGRELDSFLRDLPGDLPENLSGA